MTSCSSQPKSLVQGFSNGLEACILMNRLTHVHVAAGEVLVSALCHWLGPGDEDGSQSSPAAGEGLTRASRSTRAWKSLSSLGSCLYD